MVLKPKSPPECFGTFQEEARQAQALAIQPLVCGVGLGGRGRHGVGIIGDGFQRAETGVFG